MSAPVYLQFFGLKEAPFAITPDPRYVYLSPRHEDALAHLLYGVGRGGSGGFVQLTGEVGTGKTTLCRTLLEQVPEKVHIALLLNPILTPPELVASICRELGLDPSADGDRLPALVQRLNTFLLAAHSRGERVVVVIDEAQNLPVASLEQVRLLTNLETHTQKLLQVILLGQPELREVLARDDLRQLAQRVTARFHLSPLAADETGAYVRHRLAVAGNRHRLFSREALAVLHRQSQGVPRLINIIADRALTAAYARDQEQVDAGLVHAAAKEVRGDPIASGRKASQWRGLAGAAVLLLLITVAAGWAWTRNTTPPPPVAEVITEAEPEPAPDVAPPTLDSDWLQRQDARSFEHLAALWGAPDAGTSLRTACRRDQADGYACLRMAGSWARLRQLGLPVLLHLGGDDAGYLLLQGISGDNVMVGGDESLRELPIAALEDRWLGDFSVVWPQADDWPRALGEGAEGEAVTRVKDLASRRQPPFTGATDAVFDADFRRWVERFQGARGLEVDGILGPATLLYLIAPDIGAPRLRTGAPAGVVQIVD